MSAPPPPIRVLELSLEGLPARVMRACAGVVLVLLLSDLLFTWIDVAEDRSITRIWNIAREQSVPTFFASLQALAVGLGAAICGALGAGRRERGWAFVALFFAYIAVDDAAEIHERVGSWLGRLSEDGGAVGALAEANPSYDWQLFIAPVLDLGLVLSLGLLFWRSERWGRALVVLAAGGFALSQGLDSLEGTEGLVEGLAARLGIEDPYNLSHPQKLLEECLEMLSTTACLGVVLRLLVTRARGLVLRLG